MSQTKRYRLHTHLIYRMNSFHEYISGWRGGHWNTHVESDYRCPEVARPEMSSKARMGLAVQPDWELWKNFPPNTQVDEKQLFFLKEVYHLSKRPDIINLHIINLYNSFIPPEHFLQFVYFISSRHQLSLRLQRLSNVKTLKVDFLMLREDRSDVRMS